MIFAKEIYLDYCASTPLDFDVHEVMAQTLGDFYGNPSSRHSSGRRVKRVLEHARAKIAALISAQPQEVIFTSGATESISIGLLGLLSHHESHVISCRTEHKAVLNTLAYCQKYFGTQITWITPNHSGQLTCLQVEQALRADTKAVVLMWANNETGVIHPVESIGNLCKQKGIVFFSDATQAVGRIPVDANCADLLALSAHKFYGPRGVGALFIRREVQDRLTKVFSGGGQERNFRGGTQNVLGIVGLGAAAEKALRVLDQDLSHCRDLQSMLETTLIRKIEGSYIHSSHAKRTPYCTNVYLGIDNQILLSHLRNVSISAGSACNQMSHEPSHVLQAMNIPRKEALQSVRISIGRSTVPNDVIDGVAHISRVCEQIRTML